ncbi:MAG: DNA polymerase III subunit beta [Gammaproteobacteria bacterium]|nr:DNA polymerase III subunit beta [Gammaproteobacteria bacterium]MBQ0839274.1 DNA polymerase III subunit beta [Gammaproteobacteria bacterium]
MKFSVSKETFVKQLQMVVGVVERRQTLPILANVLISLKDGELALTGTDLEVEIVSRAASETGAELSGEITVPARKLLDICRSLPDGVDIKFSTNDKGRVVITSGRSRFTLSTLPAEEFPNVEDGAENFEFSLPAKNLKHLIDSTSFAMAHQDVRYYLNGMLWEVSGSKLNGVATDGHRLAISSIELPGETASNPVQAILPRKGVVELSRLLVDEGEITISLGDAHLRVRGSDFHFTSKLVDGAYPDYDKVLPKGGSLVIRGDRDGLRQAFSRAAILSNEKYRGVRLLLNDNLLNIIANNPEQEEAQEEVTVSYTGPELEVGFNVNYILDVLNTLAGEEVVFILSDANSSALIQDPADEAASYVIMPMRL